MNFQRGEDEIPLQDSLLLAGWLAGCLLGNVFLEL